MNPMYASVANLSLTHGSGGDNADKIKAATPLSHTPCLLLSTPLCNMQYDRDLCNPFFYHPLHCAYLLWDEGQR